MMGLSHAIVGATLYLALDRFTSIGYSSSALVDCLGAAALGSLAPDLDSPKSFLGRRFFLFSWAAKQLVGHRGFSHSLAAGAAVCLGLAFAGRFYPAWNPYLAAFAIGYASHILADWSTREGVPLFWPARRRYRSPINFRTGGLAEVAFSLAAGSFLGFWLYRIIA